MDGTFRSCSKQFDQLYIIHGEVQIFSSKVRLPLVYVLMPDRKTEIYDHVFKTLIDKCTELFGVRLKPSLIKIDFEQVVLKSLQKHFPESKISGCNFHFNQCLYRRIQHEGLAAEYRDNAEVQQYVRMVAALAHLPVDDVIDGWLAVMEDYPANNQKLNAWNDYFVSQWVENSNLPLSIWNVCGEEHRTNNTCEGYNNRLNRAVRTLHPNIYELITVLQLEEASTRLTIHQTESGEPPKKRRKLYKNLNDKLAKFLVEYRQGDRPIKCYLKAVGYILKL